MTLLFGHTHSVIATFSTSSGAGLEVGWCKDPDRGLPAPDKIFFLDISVEDAMKVCLGIVVLAVCRWGVTCVMYARGRGSETLEHTSAFSFCRAVFLCAV